MAVYGILAWPRLEGLPEAEQKSGESSLALGRLAQFALANFSRRRRYNKSSLIVWYYGHMSNLVSRPVVAVIPHYNMPQTLVSLVVQVIAQQYDAIYVLDDHSTTCDIEEVVAPFGSAVNLVVGAENLGAGPNRNRILEADPKNLRGAILHFIDADCEILTDNVPETARKLFSDRKVGAVGGLISNSNGAQMEFNYFPRFSWSGGLSGMLMMAGKQMPRPLQRFVSDYPNPHVPPVAKNVFAVAEANMLIPFDTFASVNGFDDALRFAEAQDLGFKLEAKGLTVRFDPIIAVKHHMVLLPDRKRVRYLLQSFLHLARKYGMSLR